MSKIGIPQTMSYEADSFVHANRLTEYLNEQRKSGEFCDVLLNVGDRLFPSHSCILSACSPFFRALILGQRPTPPYLSDVQQEIMLDMTEIIAEPTGSELQVPDMDADEIVVHLLDFIYTGKMDFKEDNVGVFMRLAEALMMYELTDLLKGLDPADGLIPAVAVLDTNLQEIPEICSGDIVPPSPESGVKETSRPLIRKKFGKSRPKKRSRLRESGCDSIEFGSTNNRKGRVDSDGLISRKIFSFDDNVGKGKRNKEDGKGRNQYRCKSCEFESNDSDAIRKHRQIHGHIKAYRCSSCSLVFQTTSQLVTHLLGVKHSETECSLCGSDVAATNDPDAYRQHLLRHAEDPSHPFFCSICNRRFKSRAPFLIHMPHHSSLRPFSCEICGSAFKWKHILQNHMLSHEPSAKSHLCHLCGFATAYKHNLLLHVRTLHNAEAKFKCPRGRCDFRAGDRSVIDEHVSMVHADDDAKPHQCDVCGKKFAQERSMKRHWKTHNPEGHLLRCDRCLFTTTRADKLRIHKRNQQCEKFGPKRKKLKQSETNADISDWSSEALELNVKMEHLQSLGCVQ